MTLIELQQKLGEQVDLLSNPAHSAARSIPPMPVNNEKCVNIVPPFIAQFRSIVNQSLSKH